MDFLRVSQKDRIATLVLNRGKVNAFNEAMIGEISGYLTALAKTPPLAPPLFAERVNSFPLGSIFPSS